MSQTIAPFVELERFLTQEAAATEQSLPEFLENLMDVLRLADPDAEQFHTVAKMEEWLLTAKGREVLELTLTSLNIAAAIKRAVDKALLSRDTDKSQMGMSLALLSQIFPQERGEAAELSLLMERAARIARRRDTSQYDAIATSVLESAQAYFETRTKTAQTPTELFDQEGMYGLLDQRYSELRQHHQHPHHHQQHRRDEEKADLARRLAEEAIRTRPTEPPAWVANLKPLNPATDGTNGMHRVIGAWPGDETDEEINEALAEIS